VPCCFPFHCLLSCSLDPRPSPLHLHRHRHSDSLLSSSSHSALIFLSSLSSSPYPRSSRIHLLINRSHNPSQLQFSLILSFFAQHPHSPSQYPCTHSLQPATSSSRKSFVLYCIELGWDSRGATLINKLVGDLSFNPGLWVLGLSPCFSCFVSLESLYFELVYNMDGYAFVMDDVPVRFLHFLHLFGDSR
jgi:hypothetical protein